jgi:transposase
MCPNRVKSRQDAIQQEGRISLAIQAINNKEISSIRQAAERFQVDRSTLTRRLRGTTSRAETRPNSHKLTEIEEESLLQWILSMDDRGGAPRPSTVREMAALLLQHRGIRNTTPIGQNWVTKFVNRHPEIKSRFSRRYNYERAKQEDPKVIRQWFTTVQEVITAYGILSEDIYNFDETGFAIGLTTTARVITRAEYYGRRSVLQPGNRT